MVAFEAPWQAIHLLRAALSLLFGAGAAFGIGYTLLACGLIGRFFARPAPPPTGFPAVTIVKPVRGNERALLRNLVSFCRQDYPGPVQYLFGANDAQDPALQAIGELRRLHPGAHITVVTDSRLHGSNRKVSNIINMLPQAQHDVLVFADSDVGVAPDYLRSLMGELEQPGVGLVTCLYRGQPDPGFWPRLSAIATDCQFLPNAVVGLGLGLARPCFGQTIALRRSTLAAIGGFAPLVNYLAEDHAIGEAVRATGAKVIVPPFAISHACVESSLAQLFTHELRWSRTIRSVDPAGHFGSALAQPLPLAALAIVASGGARWSWLLALAALAARLALKLRTEHVLRQPHRDPWLLPAWDLVSLAVFLASFLSKRVTWRGVRFDVDAKGDLTPVPPA
jgi:ceramide glucosyltransferase